MWELHFCNMIAALSKPPWTKPLDWRFQMTADGEEHVPFHLHVQPDSAYSSSSHNLSFPGFRRLPTELQLRILAFCAPPTLYQLLRMPIHRTEAAKIFWADSEVYYPVAARWVLTGGHSAYTLYDLSFMAYVQNVEVDYYINCDGFLCPSHDGGVDPRHDRALEFWKVFQKRFPSAKKVVFNQNYDPRPPWLLDGSEPVSRPLNMLIETCPAGLDALAYVLIEKLSGLSTLTVLQVLSNWHKVLYRLGKEGGWEKVITSGFERKTVLMPPKKFHGPVGEYERVRYESDKIRRQKYGLGALAIEALDRYHFDKEDPSPFHCLASECHAYFDKAGQWMIHAAETYTHTTDLITRSKFDILPDDLRKRFEERRDSLDEKLEEAYAPSGKMSDEWNEEDGKRVVISVRPR